MLTSASVRQQSLRRAAVAGTWYPGEAAALRRAVERHLERATGPRYRQVVALLTPHAGLVYSGPVAAYAYRVVAARDLTDPERAAPPYDAVVLVGPSHYVGFDGVSVWERGGFETPLGIVPVAEEYAAAIQAASPIVRAYPAAHLREHSLEMQLPFLQTVLPGTPIVPLVMGYQTRETIVALADALACALRDKPVLLVASTDLSHYFPAAQAEALDGRVIDYVKRFDVEGLLAEFEQYPEGERGRFVACGGGPAIAVMQAARALGARAAAVLHYAHSGHVSGDLSAVVGYLAAAFGVLDGDGAAPSEA